MMGTMTYYKVMKLLMHTAFLVINGWMFVTIGDG